MKTTTYWAVYWKEQKLGDQYIPLLCVSRKEARAEAKRLLPIGKVGKVQVKLVK